MSDSTPLRRPDPAPPRKSPADTKADASVDSPADSHSAKKHRLNHLLTIFFMFLIVVSDFFINNVISKCGKKTMQGRFPSAWGIVLQGVFLVIGVSIMTYINQM